jgi:nitrate/nitrite transport system substrate-binding protein
MVLSLGSPSLSDKWQNLESDRGEFNQLKVKCAICGGYHMTTDHQRFLSEMPQQPEDLIDDLIKMRLYQPDALNVADTLTQADLRKSLFLKIAGRGDRKRERLVNDLIKMAGGLDEAFAAAFGPRAGTFFNDAKRYSDFSRRRFLRNVAIGAALTTLASCGMREETPPPSETSAPIDTSSLEKTNLKVGFLPITCATPIIMSEPLGFYEKHGLNVEVVKMPSWSVVRDSAIAGELDAYHMLAPMPISMTLGLGSTAFAVKLASIENNNGQGIAVAMQHQGKINGPADFKGMTIGLPFDYSNHNLILRYYLASGGLNPDQDCNLQNLPPPDAVAKMASGQLDAFLLPDNLVQRVVFEKIGFIHLLTKDLWPGHPCCSFVASQQWIDENPNTFRAINKAIIDGATYANDPANRPEIAKAIAPREYLNQPVEVLEAVLTGKFDDGLGNMMDVPDRIYFDPYPWQSFADWIVTQMVRWDYLPAEKANYSEIGEQIFLTDLARELAAELGVEAPQELARKEELKFDTLDPADPEAYLQQQIEQFGV